jgi:undecaprenyl-diphosphatase
MTILQAFILGIVQGITEFLPISSSGHLVLTPYLLNWQIPEEQVFIFDVLVQIGSLVAVIAYFRQDLWSIIAVTFSSLGKPDALKKQEVRMGLYLILASIPAVLFGLAFKDMVESAFSSPVFTIYALIITAFLLVIAERIGKRSKKLESIGWLDALVMGLFQALALFPGISRSGSTISGGMLRNLDRRSAARFSFLMAVPVMLGAGALAALDLFSIPSLGQFMLPMIIGFVTAMVVSYLSIHWLLRFLADHPLYTFSIYLIAAATLILVLK